MHDATASAQGLAAHGMQAGPRPLHDRLASARIALVGRVLQIREGRIRVARDLPLVGESDVEFEVKRSPSRPPEIVAGDHALFLLVGERPPYVLVDEPRELAVIEADELDRWREALAAFVVAANSADRSTLIDQYEDWLDEGPPSLRSLGLRALVDPSGVLPPLDDDFARRRVSVALSEDRDVETRVASAYAASLAAHGTDRLLGGLDVGGSADPPRELVIVALQSGVRVRSPDTLATAIRMLGHDDPEVRSVAARIIPTVDRDAASRDVLVRLAETDPDDSVVRSARSALARYDERAVDRQGTHDIPPASREPSRRDEPR